MVKNTYMYGFRTLNSMEMTGSRNTLSSYLRSSWRSRSIHCWIIRLLWSDFECFFMLSVRVYSLVRQKNAACVSQNIFLPHV